MQFLASWIVYCVSVGIAAIYTPTCQAVLPPFNVPAYDFDTMPQHSEAMLKSLQAFGLLSIKNIPGYGEAREALLRAGMECIVAHTQAKNKPHDSNGILKRVFEDATERYTISSKANIDATWSGVKDCANYQQSLASLSTIMQKAVVEFAGIFDPTKEQADKVVQTTGFQNLVAHAQHLDHFHAYASASHKESEDDDIERNSNASPTLELHVDSGLFIAMVAPQYYEADSVTESFHEMHGDRNLNPDSDSGLFIQLPNDGAPSSLVRPVMKENEMVIMLGQGFSDWITMEKDNQVFKAVQHGMNMPRSNSHKAKSYRVWFGKMVLLPLEYQMKNTGMAFGAYATATTRYLLAQNSGKDSPFPLACPRGLQLVSSDNACTVKMCKLKSNVTDDVKDECGYWCNTNMKGDQKKCSDLCDCDSDGGSGEAGLMCWMYCRPRLEESKCLQQQCAKMKNGNEDREIQCIVPASSEKDKKEGDDEKKQDSGSSGAASSVSWLRVYPTVLIGFSMALVYHYVIPQCM